jgi:hypothetical protein
METTSRALHWNTVAVLAGASTFALVLLGDSWARNDSHVWYVPSWYPLNSMLLYQQLHDIAFGLFPAFIVGSIAVSRPLLLGGLVAGAGNVVVHGIARGDGFRLVWSLVSGQTLTPDQHAAASSSARAFLAATAQSFATAAVYGAAAAALGWYVRTVIVGDRPNREPSARIR